MKTTQLVWRDNSWCGEQAIDEAFYSQRCLILVFGLTDDAPIAIQQLTSRFVQAEIVGCSTAGEITRDEVLDLSLVATVVLFEKGHFFCAYARLEDYAHDGFQAGAALTAQLHQRREDLSHIFILSDGLNVNGAELVRGARSELPQGVQITGGLAGDRQAFVKTYALWQGDYHSEVVVAIGFYGAQLKMGYGSRGGWTAFGMKRKITRATDNVLYELDDQNALEVYKSYLGELSNELPASGLRFPLELEIRGKDTKLVRTLLAIDEQVGSITFAGDVPTGASARLMRANVDSLIDGAQEAGDIAVSPPPQSKALSILVSCLGRKLLLKQLAEEEVMAVADSLPAQTTLCGFYSYGEIAPWEINCDAELHNQTMTITTLWEE
uniref:FIST signal transduction protein n=1 Tax=Thaumasiovibrio occultus TaxID=1891184 RepID=UPI000B35213C|nr:FIST N-terminal domain-containing protein [Thaumasiovibrio occultus]